jgi:hypothetical protein
MLADQITIRNKIPEIRRPDYPSKGLKTPDHEQKLQLDGPEDPTFRKLYQAVGEGRMNATVIGKRGVASIQKTKETSILPND